MGCGCGKTKRVYVVTRSDGVVETVDSLVAAMKIVRQYGGKYQQATVAK